MTTELPSWENLLAEAVMKPGVVSAAYRAFHNYSTGNQILALVQCFMRDIPPGPIATFPGWKAKGRHVKRGEKAISLCMPVSVKVKGDRPTDAIDAADSKPATFTKFIYRPNWFVLSQTDGVAVTPEPLPTWDESTALAALNIERIPFDKLSGNCQGFARERQVAVSPIAFAPMKTLFHELAHVLLGHTSESQQSDDEQTPRNIAEVEAESIALLCLESLGLPGGDHCRGYVQHWLAGDDIPERSAQKIFKAADQILKAGAPAKAE